VGTELAAVTFAELADLIRRELGDGYSRTERQEGRRRLLRVVEELAAATSDGPDQLLTGRTWRIAEVRIAGLGSDRWAAAYGVARRAAIVYGETSTVLHSNRAFGDLPEHVVREWEQVVAEVGYAVAAASRPAPK